MRRLINFCLLFFLFAFLIFYYPIEGSYAEGELKQKQGHEKIESSLLDLKSEYINLLGGDAERIPLSLGQGEIIIFIYLKEGEAKESLFESIKKLGGEVIKKGERVIKAKIPISSLESLAQRDDVLFLKLPDQPVMTSLSEGVQLTGASLFHNSNIRGEGIKVAIIDLGFAGLSTSIQNGYLPNTVVKIDCTGSSCEATDFSGESEIHGTAVAEIVHEMAPEAQLYLIKVGDSLDLRDAKDFCINHGVHIINHSVGWFNVNFNDGSCYFESPVCSADHAFRSGILWVNSIGNHAQKHYEAVFSDTDGDRLHNVSGTNNYITLRAEEGEVISLCLTWDRWPETSQDFDLFLLNSSLEVVKKSLNFQTGTQPPIEQITYFVSQSGTYYVAIQRYNASESPRFKLFSLYHNLNPHVTWGSLLSPADARGVMAVSAIHYTDWESGPCEEFSSRGPTSDGRTKPEISGPDGTSNFSYGEFYGTSASSPHVAGASALLLSAHRDLEVSQLWEGLTSSAIDLGTLGQDNIYGYGKLSLSSMKIDPSYLDFGSVQIGSSSSMVLSIENRIQTPLSIIRINPLDSPYHVLEDECSGRTLSLRESCSLRIGFSPQQIGEFNESLRILSNDPIQSLKSVSISGKGTSPITLVLPENGFSINPCFDTNQRNLMWTFTYPFKQFEVQFSKEESFKEISLKMRVGGDRNSLFLSNYKLRKIFNLLSESGKELYWRVVGFSEEGASVFSPIHSLRISSPLPIEDWSISSTKKSEVPTLSWNNSCHKKVRVRFGGDPDFISAKSYTYFLSPTVGSFQKRLTNFQWRSIQALVGNQNDLPIYWFIESWDTLNRYSRTETRFFFLSDE